MKHRFWLAITTLGLLLACSSNDPTTTTTAPTISLQAVPEVIAPGQSSQLSWQVSGSEPITLRLSPEVDPEVTPELTSPVTISPAETTTYTLTASNSVGSTSASVTVTVTDEPTISAFSATPAEGTTPLTVRFDWTLNLATGCTFNADDGSDSQAFDDCLASSQATHTYQQAGTYEARLTLENGNTQTATVTVTPADDTVSVGGFVDEQSRNVVIILTDEGQKSVTLNSLNRALAEVATSLGAEDAPTVRGVNAALVSLLAQQNAPDTNTTDTNTADEAAQLFSLAGDFVVAVASDGQVVGSSRLDTISDSADSADSANNSRLRFDLDIPADTTVALLLAEPDGQNWFCKGSLEYQITQDQATRSSQQTLYRFPASLVNNPSLQAGRFVFNELTGQPAARLAGDSNSMVGDVPEAAVLDALITPEDAPAFADGIYRLCANTAATQTNVLADLDWQSDAFGQTTNDDLIQGESTLYDYAIALLVSEQDGSRRLLGSAPINPDGTLAVPLVYGETASAQLIMVDVAFFDASKRRFPLTPAYGFDADVQAAGEAELDLQQQSGGLAYISGNVVTGTGDIIAGANVIMVVDGERLAFNVATADDNGFFELLIPVSDDDYVLYAQNPAATLGGIASNDPTGVRYLVDSSAAINQNIVLNVPINANIDPSTRPEVSAGSDVVIPVGDSVRLQGSASDPDGDELSLRWQVLTQPANSNLMLSGANSDAVTFTPERVGDYVLRFAAADGRSLAADLVTVRVVADLLSVNSVQFTNAPQFAELVEGGTGYVLELSRSGSDSEPLTVGLQLATDSTSEPTEIRLEGVTAAGNDYLITFAAGQVRTRVTVFALADDTPEEAELLVLELATSNNYTISPPNQASFIITDTSNPIDPTPPTPPSRCEGSFVVRQAADLVTLERCQIITGDLTIDPLEPLSSQQTEPQSDITSLEQLDNLQIILGTLTIRNTALESLTGLDNLQQIGGNLTIASNPVLTDLSAIAALTDSNVKGSVTINGNSSLDCPAQNLAFTVNVSTDNLVNCNEPPDPIDPVVDAPVITTFTATPDVINAEQSSLLEWVVTSTAPVTLLLEGGATTQNVSAQTSLTVNPTVTSDYILRATNSAGEDQATATVTVNPTATTCVGDYLVTSQADLDNLATCTVITGNLVLEDTPITDLTPLANLISIGGSLLLRDNQNLLNLAGLENLTNVGGGLDIDNNPLLTSLEPLSNLQTIGGFLDIDDTALTDLTGLGSLTSIGGTLFFNTNNQLSSLTGLERLTSIGGYLEIFGNSLLTSLNGLEALTSIGGNVYIGFDLGGNRIFGNATLADLSAIADLTDADIAGADRVVTGNPALDCLAQNLGFTVTVSEGNLVNCGGETEICTGDFSVSSQAQLDALAICSEITGNLTITGSTDIITLAALTNLMTIGGNLEILENPGLTSTAGLENLTTLGGNLRLNINDALISLEGFTGLTAVGELYIGLSGNLTDLSGFENLTSATRIDIIGNELLEDISALESITSPVSRLIIQGNASLTDLTGLGGITTVTDDVLILANDALTTLTGLAVTDITNNLEIQDNPALNDLTGLESLSSIGNTIQIANNDALTSLAALNNLTSVGGSILVQENAILPNLSGLQNIAGYNDANNVNVTNNPLLNCSQPTPTPTLSFAVDVSSGNSFNCGDVALRICEGDYTIDDINYNSRLDLSTCEEITGSLTINTVLIDNVDFLSNLVTLGGDLTLLNSTSLRDLTGFSNLTNFTGDLLIDNIAAFDPDLTGLAGITTPNNVTLRSASLTSLAGLNLITVTGDLTLTALPSLTDFASLTSLTSVGGNLQLENLNFADLSFLTNLTSVGGDITIFNNDRTSFTNLAGIENITGYNDANTVTISDNGFLNCTPPPTLPFIVDVSVDNLVDCDTTVVCPGDYTVTNQAQLDALALCSEITGTLTIENSIDIVDLSALINLTSIGTSAADDLVIRNNSGLQSLAGLTNLTMVAGQLNLDNNDNASFTTLTGLDNLTTINFFKINNHNALLNLTGLNSLTIYRSPEITNNTALNDISALSGATYGGGTVRVENNAALLNLIGLAGVDNSSFVFIGSNTSLASLDGLNN